MRSKPRTTREQVVARLDIAIERTAKRRIALRLAERAMVEARRGLEKFDEEAARTAAPVHQRGGRP